MAEVWYAIPSANPELCRAHLPAWRERGYRVAVLQNRERAEIPADLVVLSDTYPGWAASVNLLCANVVPSSADIVVTGGDDMLPDPDHTADELASEFFGHFPDGFGVMQPTGDGFMHCAEYCGSPWLGRGWIEHAYTGEGPMHPGYRHNWADHELRWVSDALGALWMRDDITQTHAHFSRAGAQAPAYWHEQVGAHDRADVELFIARLLLGFPGHAARGTMVEAAWWRERYPGTAHRHWATRYAGRLFASDDSELLRVALERCAAMGCGRVAVFGAGTATQRSGEALRSPGVQVVCLIDDHPSFAGTTMWGYPVRTLAQTVAESLDGVIVHARGDAEPMVQRAKDALGEGVVVVSSAHAAPVREEVLRAG